MEVHYSSKKHTLETPQDFFNKLNEIFNFNLDSCAEIGTAKCLNFYTKEDDALTKDWKGVVWCNPPYGREQAKFVLKAYEESVKHNSTVVVLIPARPDTKLWQNTIFPNANQICFIKGRLKFGGAKGRLKFGGAKGRLKFGGAKESAPFPSALVVFGNEVDLSSFGYCI